MKEFFEQLYIRRILQYILYMFLSLMLQNMVFTQIRPFGVCPMVLPSVCVAVHRAVSGDCVFFRVCMPVFCEQKVLRIHGAFPGCRFCHGHGADGCHLGGRCLVTRDAENRGAADDLVNAAVYSGLLPARAVDQLMHRARRFLRNV